MPYNRVKPEKIDRWLFIIIFIFIGTLIAGSIFAVYQAQYREYQTWMALKGQLNLENQESLVNLRFDSIAADTVLLTNFYCLERAAEAGDFSSVKKDFVSFVNAKKNFDQLRFLDTSGMEIVRVNSRNGVVKIVPSEELQDKSDRYYVVEGMKLSQGEIYVSPLDLNIERGKVESPQVPMMRFVSPVYIKDKKAGLIVINYRASQMLEDLESFGVKTEGLFFLLNREGYYLASPDDEEEWGFMFSEGELKRYSLMEPDRWRQISSNETYQYESSDGIVSSRIIRPLSRIGNQDYYWFAINIVPKESLVENSRALIRRLFMLGGFLLLLSVAPAWGLSKVIIRRRRLKRELYYSANFDELTELPNRHLLNDRLEQALSQARRFHHKGVLLFLDLDGFKSVNDKYGHDKGDELLRLLGKRLKAGIRDSDTAARLGGDEFVVLVPVEKELEGVKALASKLIEVISHPYSLTGVEVSVGVSIGIRFFTNEDQDTIINDADSAMYKAKSEGKGRYSIFEERE
ncbi:MAG: diguanylate cyclase [Spirochaetaceae bacterium]|nr:diguanylate cyclase [Spirochaetaceae bacterium]